MDKMMDFAGQRGKKHPNIGNKRAFPALDSSDFKWVQSARVIRNKLLICSAHT
jgi:hypothetical protein